MNGVGHIIHQWPTTMNIRLSIMSHFYFYDNISFSSMFIIVATWFVKSIDDVGHC